jgi:hypothetical protein
MYISFKCPFCNNSIRRYFRRCNFCGNDIKSPNMECPSCSESIPYRSRRCKCGAAILIAGQPFPTWEPPDAALSRDNEKDVWQISLQFVYDPDPNKCLNWQYRDAKVYLNGIDWIGVTEDKVEETTLCMGYWKLQAPRHLCDPKYLAPEDSPWRRIKEFATIHDFLSDSHVKHNPVDGAIFYDEKGHWHAQCLLYHDYLTWRTYQAVELYLECLPKHSRGPRNSGRTSNPIDSFRETVIQRQLLPANTSSLAPSLADRIEPYDQPEFVRSVRQLLRYSDTEWRSLQYSAYFGT